MISNSNHAKETATIANGGRACLCWTFDNILMKSVTTATHRTVDITCRASVIRERITLSHMCTMVVRTGNRKPTPCQSWNNQRLAITSDTLTPNQASTQAMICSNGQRNGHTKRSSRHESITDQCKDVLPLDSY